MKRKELFSAFPVKDLGGAGDRREDNRLLVTGLSGDRKLQQLCGKIELLALPTWPLVWIDGLKKITKGFAEKLGCSVLVSETLLLFRRVLSLFLGVLEKIPWNLYYHSIGMYFKWRHCSVYGHHVSYAAVRWSVSMRKGCVSEQGSVHSTLSLLSKAFIGSPSVSGQMHNLL